MTLGIESRKGFNEADVNENKIFRGKGRNPQSTATVGETRAEEIRGAADEIKSETNSDELGRENNELAQISPQPEKLSLCASEAKMRGEEKSTNKRKRGQHEGKRVDDVCKKVKIERGKKNIKQESVERLKHLQKGENYPRSKSKKNAMNILCKEYR